MVRYDDQKDIDVKLQTLEVLQAENELLRAKVAELEKRSTEEKQGAMLSYDIHQQQHSSSCSSSEHLIYPGCQLTNYQISRYSRHLLLGQVGVAGQARLLASSVLVVGAGGLGSAALPYLVGAGVGRVGIVDFDCLEESNLHRQVLYREEHAGLSKAACAAASLRGLNSSMKVEAYEARFTSANALDLVKGYDVVIDCSDNPATRYLVNDAAVLAGKPLVSGSALGLEGQVTVYNAMMMASTSEEEGKIKAKGPCYRCVFPRPMAHEAGRTCSDNGVVGAVPGVIGCLQAMEALKLLGGFGEVLSNKLCTFDASDCTFYTVKLKGPNPLCAVCGTFASTTDMSPSNNSSVNRSPSLPPPPPPPHLLSSLSSSSACTVLEECGEGCFGLLASSSSVAAPVAGLPTVSCTQYARIRKADSSATAFLPESGDGRSDYNGTDGGSGGGGESASGTSKKRRSHVLIDVRVEPQFNICHLDNAVNITLAQLHSDSDGQFLERIKTLQGECAGDYDGDSLNGPLRRGAVYCLCRRGIASRKAVELLLQKGLTDVYDIAGGLIQWTKEVDPSFPTY